MCTCGPKPKTRIHYLLRYNLYSDLRAELLNDICALTLKNLSHKKLLNTLLHESENLTFDTNKKLIKSTITFLKSSEPFIAPLF